VNPPGVVTIEHVVVPDLPHDGDVPQFLEQVEGVLPCLLNLDWMVGLDPRRPVL
jgi:hypothetical protein